MHELSVAASLLSWAREQARAHEPRAMRSIELEMDPLSCLNPEALRFGFDALTSGTPLEGVRLDFVTVEPRYACRACGVEMGSETAPASCSACGAPFPRLARDSSLRVVSVEVE